MQATDEFVGVRNARIVLADGPDGVRATMTASWLIQLGHADVHVLAAEPEAPETGHPDPAPALFRAWPDTVTADSLKLALAGGDAPAVVDLDTSLRYRRGHIPGARWTVRARVGDWAGKLPGTDVVLTSADGLLAHYTAHDLAAARADLTIRVLDGGTAAWRDAGGELEEERIEELALTAIDDVWWKPYDNRQQVREQMENYLTWEVGLVEQVERDGLVEFRRFD